MTSFQDLSPELKEALLVLFSEKLKELKERQNHIPIDEPMENRDTQYYFLNSLILAIERALIK